MRFLYINLNWNRWSHICRSHNWSLGRFCNTQCNFAAENETSPLIRFTLNAPVYKRRFSIQAPHNFSILLT